MLHFILLCILLAPIIVSAYILGGRQQQRVNRRHAGSSLKMKDEAKEKDASIPSSYSKEDVLLKRVVFSSKLPQGVDLSLSQKEQAVLNRKNDALEKAGEAETKKSDLDLLREELARILEAAE